jgi:hypothetical protein
MDVKSAAAHYTRIHLPGRCRPAYPSLAETIAVSARFSAAYGIAARERNFRRDAVFHQLCGFRRTFGGRHST